MQRAVAGIAIAASLLLTGCGDGAPARVQPAVAPVVSASVAPAVRSPAETDPQAGQALIARATWTVTGMGRQLQVVPTQVGRTDQFVGASARAWAEILAKAPDAGTPGMHDQFLCHWDFARVVEPDKPSWDLEPWRPAVGYDNTVDALCNPGGSQG